MTEKRSLKLPPAPEEAGSETQCWMVPGANGPAGLLVHKPAPPNFPDRLLQSEEPEHVPTHHQLLVVRNVDIGPWTWTFVINICLVLSIANGVIGALANAPKVVEMEPEPTPEPSL